MKDLWKGDLDAFLEKLDVRYTMLLAYIMYCTCIIKVMEYRNGAGSRE